MSRWLAAAAVIVFVSLGGTVALTSGESNPGQPATQPEPQSGGPPGDQAAKPNSKDRDRDGLPDSWERRYGISTTKKSGEQDPDHDQLKNRHEYQLRTNPRKRDTDRDGYSDKAEVRKGTNPRNPRSHPGFPNPGSAGVPPGWEPKQTLTDDLEVTRPGTVVSDVLLRSADILVDAPNVKIKRVMVQGGVITNQFGTTPQECAQGRRGLVVKDTTLEPAPGTSYNPSDFPALGEGGYTARRVEIKNYGEGFRASNCPVTIEDSFAYILGDDDDCDRDLHSDGLQGYDGRGLTIRNSSLIFGNDCGTSPFYVGGGGNNTGRYSVDGLLVAGGGYVFRQGVPASVTGLRIVNGSWVFGPIDVSCSTIDPWNAKIVDIDANYQVTRVVRNQPCNTEGGQ